MPARRSPLYPQGKPFSRAFLGACERRPFVTAGNKNLGLGEQKEEQRTFITRGGGAAAPLLTLDAAAAGEGLGELGAHFCLLS